MSIKQLVDYIGEPNIAEDIDDDKLVVIGNRVKRQFQQDLDSMDEWVENVERGIDLMRQEWAPKSTPWQGASNYKDPILTEASVKFGDKASLEILRAPDLVGSGVVGRDPRGQKKEISKRVSEFMNYQVNHDMGGWRDDQERLFYCLPNYGTVFKKLVHDEVENKNESVVITFPNFAVNQATKSMDECRSFSHILDLNRNQIEERIRSGSWLDVELYSTEQDESGEDLDADKGSNEANGVTDAADNEDAFIEQQCYFDVDEDGYEEPYIVTIHSKTCKVVRVVPRFDEQSIIVKYNDQILPLPKARQIYKQAQMEEYGGPQGLELMGLDESITEAPVDEFELLKIEPFQNVIKYGFIPAPDGTFLDFGYAHLLAAMTQAVNTTTNMLTDAGVLSNTGGGLLSKEFRKTPGVQRLKPGEYKKTDVPAEKLAKGVFPNPAPEPSQTLYQLNADMLERAQSFLATVDISGKIQANTAPTTALAIIQEAVIPTTALFQRILKAETREFKVLFRVNQRTLDAEKYQMVLDEQADPQQDFNNEMMDIYPTANAESTSKMQRIQTAQIELEQVPMVLQAGGNPVPLIKGFFEAIGSQMTDQVFPEDGAMSPKERQQMEQMQKAQQIENEIKQLQLQILQREQDRLDRETEADIRKINAEIEEMRAGIAETLSQTIENVEKAESEHVKNQIDMYSAQMKAITDRISALGASNDRPDSVQNLVTQQRTNNTGTLQ